MIDPKYEAAIQKAFKELHGCNCEYFETISVKETWNGQTVWEGDVEAFKLFLHPHVNWGWAWAYDKGKGCEIVTVLAVPPLRDAKDAVRAFIVGKMKEQARN